MRYYIAIANGLNGKKFKNTICFSKSKESLLNHLYEMRVERLSHNYVAKILYTIREVYNEIPLLCQVEILENGKQRLVSWNSTEC